SAAKAARPVTLSTPSGRMVRWPIHLLLVTTFIGLAPVLLGAHFSGGFHYRADDLVIAGAPAEVSGEPEADFLLARPRIFSAQRVEHGIVRLAQKFHRLAVDGGSDVNFGHEAYFPTLILLGGAPGGDRSGALEQHAGHLGAVGDGAALVIDRAAGGRAGAGGL